MPCTFQAADGMQTAGGLYSSYEKRGMDNGPLMNGSEVWCFTWGQPRPEILAAFAELLASGDQRWVIVPIPTDGVESGT